MADTSKFLIIDGNNLFYRAFYALPRLTASDGTPTGAIYGFVSSLQKVREKFSPAFICVVIDAPGPTFREEMYAGYKETRQKMPEDMAVQLPIIKEIMDVIGVKRVEIEGVEADDVIGSLSKLAKGRSLDVIIVSSDKDLCQLINRSVKMYDSLKDVMIDADGVKRKFGVAPDKIVDLISLSGDPSDNIPGVPGIGNKTAAALLTEFGSVDNLISNLDYVKGKKRELLRENLEKLELSKQLAAVREDLSLPFEIEDFLSIEPDRGEVAKIFRKLGFKMKLAGDMWESGEGEDDEDTLQVSHRRIGDREEGGKYFASIENVTAAVFPVLFQENWVVGLSIDEDNYVFSPDIAGEMVSLFAGKSVKCVSHDLKTVMRNCDTLEGILRCEYGDTMLSSYLLHPEETSLSLERMVERHTDFRIGTIEGTAESKAATLARGVLLLSEALNGKLEREGFLALYEELELPLLEVLYSMEKRGVKLRKDDLDTLSTTLDHDLREIESKVAHYSGDEVNLASPKQVSFLLFEKLGLSPVKRTKTGYSTDVEVLDQLSSLHEVPVLILRHRTLSKLKSTYVDVLPGMINPDTGRIHTSFNQMQTATGRLSSSNPNLQNIPVRTEVGREIRSAFVPEEGFMFVGADYSQIELRVLAHLSGDERLREVFEKDRDVHRETAMALFEVGEGDVTPELRRRAKIVNFGILYGMTPFGLSKELKISQPEAKKYIDDYFSKYPGVKKFVAETIDGARETGFVETLLGRRRYLRDINSRNQSLRQAAERMGINTPVQGTAADLIKLSMVQLFRKLKADKLDAHMILQVHDELILEVEESVAEKAGDLLKKVMEGVVSLDVPLKVDVKRGFSWGEL